MKIRVVAVGKMKGPLAEVADSYTRRAAHYWKLTVDEVRAGGRSSDAAAVLAAEGERLAAATERSSNVWVISREGIALSSHQLARRLSDHADRGETETALLIGGAFGIAPSLTKGAGAVLSLSSMTLPHELARVLLLEQLYRAGTILRGEPYHKGPNS